MFPKLILSSLLLLAVITEWSVAYKIGVGRGDVTGPTVEVTFMGYAKLGQFGEGLHTRQYSRAFIIEDEEKRVAFVNVDAAMMGYAVKRHVIEKLNEKYGDLYNDNNVVISGIHTHSGPGGFLMHLIYDISILGYVHQTFNALVDGIFDSIVAAHENIQDGRIFMSAGRVENANINRSPSSYLENPAEERAQYADNTDKDLKQMRFVSLDGTKILGAINWFAVHPVSMNNTNHLVSSDNMGYASLLLEAEYNPQDLTGHGKFVGAFASANLGDVSPNINGPKCSISGNDCDVNTSTCPKNEGECFASGPGKDMFESTKIIGTRIYDVASKLLSQAGSWEVTGPVDFVHQFVDMSTIKVTTYNPYTKKVEEVQGCSPAMGYSFAAGTTDGVGSLQFEQNTLTDNLLWNTVRNFIVAPTKEDVDCQSPKPILLATGRATFPYEWQPKIVTTQLLRIGNVVLVAVPGELTTMSGRRMVRQLEQTATKLGEEGLYPVIAGLSNIYSSYVATPEEYRAQRYEGASTLYGPQTLSIYLEQFSSLLTALLNKQTVSPGPSPPFMDNQLLSLVPGVIYDGHPIGKDFGYVKDQPRDSYNIGDTVFATFVSANPRNNLMHNQTFLSVQRLVSENPEVWTDAYNDASWDTKFHWSRVSSILGTSDITVMWTISENATPGIYRINHYGHYKYILGGIYPYEGKTRSFQVLA